MSDSEPMDVKAQTDVAETRRRYLDLIERVLRNEVHGEPRIEAWLKAAALRLRHPRQTRNWKEFWPVKAHTMLSPERLSNLRQLTEATLRDGVPGDYIETGVWRGGACILMRAVLAAYGVTDRRVFVADSFEGLPRPDAKRYPADSADRLFS
ncbi:MAG: TylF/MycF/NovP-related O-methyltransferase, partial [Caulobacteraceae bacterium]